MNDLTLSPFEQSSDPASDPGSYPVRVLLVDDQVMIAEALKRALAEEEDIEFFYCQDPTQAIKMAMEVKPTIILQDLVMPDIDGLTLVRFFRANPKTRLLPIIVLSSKEEPKIKSEAFNVGANDYLVKLPDKIELIARIRYHSRAYVNQLKLDEAFRTLKKLTITDPLTGISNRRYFHDFLEQEWKRAARNQTPISVILSDIDFFKLFNDSYGHQTGDDCLKKVAKVLQDSLKRPSDMVARYGGEEFVVVLPETDERGALKVAERMRTNVEALDIPHSTSAIASHVTISLGVSSAIPDGKLKPNILISRADSALYQAKHDGRNRVVLASEKEKADI